MTKCKGFLGWLLGHKFESFLIKRSSKENVWDFDFDYHRNKYAVLCKRCGQEKEVNDANS